MYMLHIPKYNRLTSSITKLNPVSTEHKNKNFLFGFYNPDHVSLLKTKINITDPHIQLYSKDSVNITEKIKTLVHGEEENSVKYYYPLTYMDSFCIMDFYKKDKNTVIPFDVISFPIEEVNFRSFIEDYLHNGIGIAFPYSLLEENEQKIRFQGQIIYNNVTTSLQN